MTRNTPLATLPQSEMSFPLTDAGSKTPLPSTMCWVEATWSADQTRSRLRGTRLSPLRALDSALDLAKTTGN